MKPDYLIVPACVPHAASGIGKIPFHARGTRAGTLSGESPAVLWTVPACVPHAESGIGKIPFYARGDAGGYGSGDGGGCGSWGVAAGKRRPAPTRREDAFGEIMPVGCQICAKGLPSHGTRRAL